MAISSVRDYARLNLDAANSEAEDAHQELTQSLSRRINNLATITAWRLRVSKFIQYDVLSPPVALDVSKFIQYDVLSPPVALDVSKFIQYIVLLSFPLPPSSPRLIRWPLFSVYEPDVGYEDVPNLNLRRRLLTSFGSYFPTPVPVSSIRSRFQPYVVPEEADADVNRLLRRGASSYPFSVPVALTAARQPRPGAVDTSENDDAQPNLNFRVQLFTPSTVYQQVAHPTGDLGAIVRRSLLAYAEEEGDEIYHGFRLRERAATPSFSFVPSTGALSVFPVVFMA